MKKNARKKKIYNKLEGTLKFWKLYFKNALFYTIKNLWKRDNFLTVKYAVVYMFCIALKHLTVFSDSCI